jgi:hypothetical protein
MTDQKANIISTLVNTEETYDPNSVVLDPVRALELWNEGKKWRAASAFISIALMWMLFAGLAAMTRQFAPQSFSPFVFLGPGALVVFAVVMVLTLLKRPIALIFVTLFSAAFIFAYTFLFTWLMNLFATPSAQFVAGFAALAVAVGIAMISNHLSRGIALLDTMEKKL